MSPEKSSLRSRLTFLEHLEELRWRLWASLATIGIFSTAAYFFSKPLLNFLIHPLSQATGGNVYFHTPYEAFVVHLEVSLLAGILVASPVIFTELWLFLAPGFHRRERKVAILLTLFSVLLFLGGAAFAIWILIPWSLNFFLSFQTDTLRPLIGVGPYFSFLVWMVLISGVIFDLPVVVLGLVKAGILSQAALRKSRKGVIVSLFILAAVITPSGDPATQIFFTLPLILLYEVCVFVARWVEK